MTTLCVIVPFREDHTKQRRAQLQSLCASLQPLHCTLIVAEQTADDRLKRYAESHAVDIIIYLCRDCNTQRFARAEQQHVVQMQVVVPEARQPALQRQILSRNLSERLTIWFYPNTQKHSKTLKNTKNTELTPKQSLQL